MGYNKISIYTEVIEMDENKKNPAEEAEEEAMLYTLQDEDGKEYQFELIATYEKNGVTYYAMIPADEPEGEDEFLEYTILKVVTENGDALSWPV